MVEEHGMATQERLDGDMTQEEFEARLRAIPPDLESTPGEDADDLAAFERGEEQLREGRWITLGELERKYPD